MEIDMLPASLETGIEAKHHDREMIAQLTDEFLARGGQIEQLPVDARRIDDGVLVSGRYRHDPSARNKRSAELGRQERDKHLPVVIEMLAEGAEKKAICEATGLTYSRLQRIIEENDLLDPEALEEAE